MVNDEGALFDIDILQLSDAIGVPRFIPVAKHPEFVTARTVSGAVIIGFILSNTVTYCTALDEFPLLSVTVHVTVVLPKGKALGASFNTVATTQLSEVDGVPKFTPVAVQPEFVFTEIAIGAVIEGFVISLKVTLKLQEVLPHEFVAVRVTVVIPLLNDSPLPEPVPLPVVAPVKV